MNPTIWMMALLAWQQPQGVKDVMNEGVAEFKAGHYEQAVTLFERAVNLDPGNVNAHLYLGTAYMQLYVPGVESAENLAWADRAGEQFKGVLATRANDEIALSSLTSLDFNMKRFDEASEWNRRLLAAQPNDKGAHYWAGVIVWSKFYPALMDARVADGMKPEDPGPLRSVNRRVELTNRFGTMISDAMWHLRRAIEIDPKYADAMAYLNLLIRERADLRATAEEYRRDIAEADHWVSEALQAKGMPDHRARLAEVTPLRKVDPVCSALATQARISGIVRFTVTIGKDGSLVGAQMISGHPLLAPAALVAVKQWQFEPQPIEVLAPVDIKMNCTQQ